MLCADVILICADVILICADVILNEVKNLYIQIHYKSDIFIYFCVIFNLRYL